VELRVWGLGGVVRVELRVWSLGGVESVEFGRSCECGVEK